MEFTKSGKFAKKSAVTKIGCDHMWWSIGKNSDVHFEVLNIILQFQLNPSTGSLVITAEKPYQFMAQNRFGQSAILNQTTSKKKLSCSF